MKEQDAAHSFEELIELKEELNRTRLLLQNCNGDIIRADRELTRLRSELQQKNEVIRELIPIAQWKLRSTTDNLYDLRITKEDDPDKFAEVKRLQSLIVKAKQNN